MRILIIEDEVDIQSTLKSRLQEKGFAVDATDDGEKGSFLARTNDYDLILLDYNLPKKDGFTVCKEIREHDNKERAQVPIIIVSVTGTVPHKVTGLNLGADDYITKPFFYDELMARIQTILKRPRIRRSNVIQIGDLIIDTDTQVVRRGEESIYLTRKEFALLEYLALHAGQVVSRGTIAEHVWDMSIDLFSNTIETHILNVRKKIERKDRPKLIYSVPGRGYKIETHA